MEDLLSDVLCAPRTGGTLVQHIVDHFSHALLVGFKYLYLLFHEPRLLEQETLWDLATLPVLCELDTHLI